MNELEKELYRVVDCVLSATVTTIVTTGKPSLTKEEVLGKSRKENAVMVRSILADTLTRHGFSVTTIGQLLSRTEHQVRLMISAHDNYKKVSHAYCIAIDEIKRTLNGYKTDITTK